jgi:glyoxylase-like metal-dependent hydrolase (beta-lactamase superfamily II)
MPIARSVGGFTVTALSDGAGPYPGTRASAFADATDAQWAAADAADPGARSADGEWWLTFRSYAIRYADGPVTLVDAGFGPEGALAADWTPVPGRLPAELAAAGIDPADVSTIVLTHLHNDHMGWAVPRDTPFTAAEVVVQRADVELYTADRHEAGQYDVLIEPLRAQERLRVVSGDVDLGRGLTIVSTPGHTPGHQSVLIADGDDQLLITGDLLVHAIQLLDPTLAYAGDGDVALARETRQRVLARGSALAVSHLGTAFHDPV